VEKDAQRLGLSPERELSFVLIHGILHLLGYDHEGEEKEARRMKVKEEYYLSKFLGT
jgi:probable rRNA maturation factor